MAFLDYAPAPESTSILNLRDEYRLWIGGEWVVGGGTPFASISPSTEERSSRADTDSCTTRSPR